jgi:hypothetical protein
MFVTGRFVWISRGRLSHTHHRFSAENWHMVREVGGTSIDYEVQLSSLVCISILEELVLRLKENIAGWPLFLERLPAHNTAFS